MTAYVRARRYPRQMARDIGAGADGVAAPPRRLAARFEILTHEGFPVYRVRPRGAGRGLCLHLHGGAMVYGLNPQHYAAAVRLADESGAEVWLPEYPLPPGRDARFVTTWTAGLVARAMAAGPLVLSGDSAGAGLALGAAQARAAAEQAQPRRLVLLSPWADLTMRNPALATSGRREPLIASTVLAEAGRRYAGALDVTDPLVSPGLSDVSGLPPTTIVAGDRDVLWPDIRALADRMAAAGVPLDLTVERGLGHYWMFYPVPEARRTMTAVAATVRKALRPEVRS